MPLAIADGRWRVEEHPVDDTAWLIARYLDEPGGVRRELFKEVGGIVARKFHDEREAQAIADVMNPMPAAVHDVLGPAEIIWLKRLADAPEGRMEGSTMRSLLSLEFKGMATSQAEPGRREMDRWTITEKGRAALAENERNETK